MHRLINFDFKSIHIFVDCTRKNYEINVESSTTIETLAPLADGFDKKAETEL